MRDWLNRGPLMDPVSDPPGAPPAGDPPAFDPKAFETKFTQFADGVTKMLNGFDKKLKTQQAPPPSDPPTDPPTDPPGNVKDPALAKALKQLDTMAKSLDDEKKARLTAETAGREKDRISQIRTEVAKAGLADHSVDDAIRLFRDEVKYNDAGELVGGADELPFADFIKGICEKKTNWQPPVAAGGAGATTGKGAKTGAFTTDQIKIGMTQEQRDAAWAAIRSAAGNS